MEEDKTEDERCNCMICCALRETGENKTPIFTPKELAISFSKCSFVPGIQLNFTLNLVNNELDALISLKQG